PDDVPWRRAADDPGLSPGRDLFALCDRGYAEFGDRPLYLPGRGARPHDDPQRNEPARPDRHAGHCRGQALLAGDRGAAHGRPLRTELDLIPSSPRGEGRDLTLAFRRTGEIPAFAGMTTQAVSNDILTIPL